MIVFENPGTLDERSLFIMGLNAKPTTNAIGYFGTGLKYAISIAARRGWKVYIQPGDGTEKIIEATPTEFREKAFTIPQYDGRDLPFTTELGKNWQPWQAYRELVCNTWDEGGEIYSSQTRPAPKLNTIRIIVISEEFESIYFDHDKYFFNETNAIKLSNNIQRNNKAGHLFYRGVLVGMTQPHQSQYGYNFLTRLDISEDRSLTQLGAMEVDAKIAFAVAISTDTEIIADYLTKEPTTFEGRIEYNPHSFAEPAMKVAKDLYYSGRADLNPEIIRYFQKLDKNTNPFKELPLTNRDRKIIDSVTVLMAARGFDLSPYSIKWKCDFGDDTKLGICRKEQIGIGSRAFDEGQTCVLATLLEEYIHARYGYEDGSRSFQDWFVRQLAVEIEANEVDTA